MLPAESTKSSRNVSHSAAQAPAARSCSCSSAEGERRHHPGDAPMVGADRDRADRIALVRQRRGAALARRRRLENFADLRLHQQQNVGGDLGAGAGEAGERGGDVEDAAALRVPGDVRLRELQLRRQRLRDRGPLSPSAASVPAAPPNCSASAFSSTQRSRSAAPVRPESHTAAL